eukprot:GILK01000494.1.p1 GENE.GILK01000494.1~~GILK01000494.1.p1  ORF type:complete len:469 (-),score=91.15 GILK01000494.1:188-1594(-)
MARLCRLAALLLVFCLCSSFVYAGDNEEKDELLRRAYDNPDLQPACRAIAKGGFGAVYACTLGGKLRAVKFIPAGPKTTREAAQYECEMAQLAVTITNHDQSIINCYDFFFLVSEKTGRDEWYITTMDYYPDAIPLDAYIKQWYPTLSTANKKTGAVEVIRKAVYIWTELVMILAKLAVPGELGITHHDIKPANILYDPVMEQIYLIDWGASFTCEEKNKESGNQFSKSFADAELRFGFIPGKCGAYDIYSAVSIPIAILFGDAGELVQLRKFVIDGNHHMKEWFEVHQLHEFIAEYLCLQDPRSCASLQDGVWVARQCLARFSLFGSAMTQQEKIDTTIEQVLTDVQTILGHKLDSIMFSNAKAAAQAVTPAIATFIAEKKSDFWHQIVLQIEKRKWHDIYSLLANPLSMPEHRMDAHAIAVTLQAFWKRVNTRDTLRNVLMRSASQHLGLGVKSDKSINILGGPDE